MWNINEEPSFSVAQPPPKSFASICPKRPQSATRPQPADDVKAVLLLAAKPFIDHFWSILDLKKDAKGGLTKASFLELSVSSCKGQSRY